jgi:soluble lytic murein transglycosylase-like protein
MLIYHRHSREGVDRRVARGASQGTPVERRAGRRDRRKRARFLGFGLLCLGVAAPASAQIYSWHDANGNLVVSNRRQNGAPQAQSPTVPVPIAPAAPKTETVRATRYVAPERIRVFDDLISEHSKNHGIRADLVRAVVQVESAFDPRARSPKGALGLMQLMPATARLYSVMDAFNPAENIRGGVAYLRSLLDRYQNNEELALAAYNAGPGAVDKYSQQVPPYRETKNYVKQINHIAARPVPVRDKTIYKVTESIDGRPVVRYTDKKPPTGAYDVTASR